MNAERLLAHYTQLVDTPDAVSRLRRFILDLAVRGKLVPQDPADEPASELLKQIAKEKTRLGFKYVASSHGQVEVPFGLPAGWTWSRVGEVCSKTGSGSTPRGGKEVYKPAGIPFLRSQNIHDDGLHLNDVAYIGLDTHARMSGTKVMPGDLLLNITGGSMGRCCRIPDDFNEANVSQHVAIIRPALRGMEDFLHRLVLSPYFQTFIFDEQTGAGRGGLPKNKMDQITVALPPLAEQRRIVAKVDELMALCDRLETAHADQEARRDRLAASSLARLDRPDPETFPDDARFVLNALPHLTRRPNQITRLRQTILDLAVRGRLSRDSDRALEPVELGSVASLQNGYAFKSEWFAKTGIRLVRNVNVCHGRLDWADEARLPKDRASMYERFNLVEGDVVVSMDRPFIVSGTKVARITAADLPALLLQRVGRFVVSDQLDPDYLLLWVNSPHFSDQIAPGRSNGVPHISSKQVEAALLFVPSVVEQRRIVAKTTELMTLCDQLEAALASGQHARTRFLDAVLHEILEVADDPAVVTNVSESVVAARAAAG